MANRYDDPERDSHELVLMRHRTFNILQGTAVDSIRSSSGGYISSNAIGATYVTSTLSRL